MSYKLPDHPAAAMAAPPPALPLLRPMEVGELLDEAFDLYKRNFRLFIGIAVLLTVPLGGLLIATPAEWRNVVNIASYITGAVTSCALTYAALERSLGRETTVVAAYRFGARRFLRLLSAYVIYGLALLGGFIALVIPGFIVALWALLLVPIVVAENRGGVGAFSRARRLAAGNLWRLFFLGVGLTLVVSVFFFVLVTLAGLVEASLGTPRTATVDQTNTTSLVLQAVVIVIAVIFQAAWSPVFAAAQLLAYLDLRIRQEAYDIELLTSAVEARVATERALSLAARPTPGPLTP